MFTLGIPKSQYRRTTQVLGPELADPISYEAYKQDDGFYMFNFPDADEYEFKDIVLLLKNNGITTIGADDTLTERNIMKLTDLLKEQPSPDENNLIDVLKRSLERWKDDKVPPYDRLDSCERSDQYFEDIKDIIEDYEEDLGGDAIAMDVDSARDFSPMQEQKLRKLIDLVPLKEESEQTPLEVKAHDDNQIYYIDPRDIETYIHGKMVVAMEKLGSPSKELTRDNSDATPGQIEDTESDEDPIKDEWNHMGPGERKHLLNDLDALYLLHTHTDFDDLKSELGFDFESAIASYAGIDEPEVYEEDMEEGTCGYSKDGKPGKKPAGPHLIQKSDLQETFQRRAGIIK